LLLQALTPSALEVSLQLAEDLELERAALHRQWRQRLERARYEAERAKRQYHAVEPENRLVARTLEADWEAALAEMERLQTEYERFLATQPTPLSAEEREAIGRLAEDVPALWNAATTTAADRQAIARLMLEYVNVTVTGESEVVAVECGWAGGTRTRHDLRRPVARLTQLSDHGALLERVRVLHAEGQTTAAMAAALNAEGWKPPKRRTTFTASMVRDLLHRIGALPIMPYLTLTAKLRTREADELTIDEFATRLGMPRVTVHAWARRGWVKARKISISNDERQLWIIQADGDEIERLRARRAAGVRAFGNRKEV
jgi:DNA-binding transcriptional regulator YiaG